MLGKISRPLSRFVLKEVGGDHRSDRFAEDVRRGLTADPKFLPPMYFYDELGSKLFEAICLLPEYYLTRRESAILESHAEDIVALAAGSDKQPCRFIELGSGSAEKTRFLIEALLDRQPELDYIPIDISSESLAQSATQLSADYPNVNITAYAGEYLAVLRALRETGFPGEKGCRNVVLFLGSNIGNLDPDQSRSFLRDLRQLLSANDALLLGADLKKDPDILIPAYDDALGVTAAFNRNLLTRINKEFKADFDICMFEHLAIYNDDLGRVEMHLVSREPQTVIVEALDLTVRFDWRESIHTENSYKFDINALSDLAAECGFRLQQSWFDSERKFSFNFLVAA
jgi:L-histidine N-alpha-methyltransferase